jgi:hypothetical protein
LPQSLRTKVLYIGGPLALLIVLYAVAGFVVVPRLLRSALIENVHKTLNLTPSIGEIRFNPFKLQLELKNFELPEKSGAELLGFDRLFVDIEFSSIWHRAFVFKRIDIDSPVLNAIVARDGELNLLQLRPTSTSPKPSAQNEPLPAIRVGSFSVTKGRVAYEDRSRPTLFSLRLEPIDFQLLDFSTGMQGGRFTFTGSSRLGERVEWHGRLSVQPIASDGEFRLDSLRAHTLWEYLEDQVAFSVNSGTVDLNASYQFSLKDKLDLKVQVAKVAVTDFGLGPKGSDADWVKIPQLLLSGATADLAQRQAHVDSLTLSGLKLLTWLEPDGSFNLLQLAGPPQPAPAPASTAPAPAPASPPWQFDLGEFDLRDASISAEDRGTRPVAKVELAPLSLQVTGASLDLAKPVKVALDTRINATGSLNVHGDMWPRPTATDLSIKLTGIDLTTLQPYIAQHTSMTLLNGRLSGDATLHYGSGKPAVRGAGNFSVEKLHTIDNALRDDFINWERLDILGLKFQRDPDLLDIAQIVIRQPYARVIIESDASSNVKRVLTGPAAAPAATPAAAPVAAARIATPAPQAASAPMPMAIRKILIKSGQVNFADLSIQPNFAAGIQALEGTVLGLSSNANSRATVDLHGSVGAYSPVSITGQVNVLGTPLYTDLAMDFRDIELTVFNPYSGKFAGYNITKGKLTTELHYKVNGRKLDAQHHIVIDQLEFGAKTASKDAVSLPVKLAVALLKDRNGVIDLNLPVTGSLDDPQFRLGPIIWKVLVNLLEKAVTAPFALLGALFGGGPDTQFIDFQPGAAVPEASGADRLKSVAKALVERPQLKIELPIATAPEVDGPALIDARFKEQLRSAETLRSGPKKSAPAAPSTDFDELDPAAKLDLLTQMYGRSPGGKPTYPDAVGGMTDKAAMTIAKIDYLTQELRKRIVIGDAELNALGQQRALALQQALLTGTQIDPGRVFLVANGKAKVQGGLVRLELTLQ